MARHNRTIFYEKCYLSPHSCVYILAGDKNMHFKRYRKRVPTIARRLNEEDYQQYAGVIQTPEGPETFQIGDYLACDSNGVWPIQQELLHTRYQQISAPDAAGWARYQATDLREAVQMDTSFTVSDLTAEAGGLC
jgi:hypothetical protein